MNKNLVNLKNAISINSSYNTSVKNSFLTFYQDKINNEWEYASDVFLIQEELPFASKQYSEIEVRINSVKVPEVNTKASDDYKKIIFKNPDGHYGIGCLYYFMDNYWIAIKTNMLGSATDSIIVRRCNNFLKWIDNNGIVHSEPCVMEYTVSGNNNAKTTDITGVSGNIKGYVQRNSITQSLYSNQRFLLGTPELWSAIKITGNGINNFLNQRTGDYSSNAMIEITFIESEKNEDTDNLVDGIADYYKFKIYIDFINIDDNILENAFVGMTGTLEWTATQNNNLLNDITVMYSVEDEILDDSVYDKYGLSLSYNENNKSILYQYSEQGLETKFDTNNQNISFIDSEKGINVNFDDEIDSIKFKNFNKSVVTIDNDGNYEFLNKGTANIVATFFRDGVEIQKKYIPVKCIDKEVEKEIKIDNIFDTILQNNEKTIQCYLYNGNEKLESKITYSVLSKEIPERCYDIIISEDTHNMTLINNEMYLYSPLIIRVESENVYYDLEIILKGRY